MQLWGHKHRADAAVVVIIATVGLGRWLNGILPWAGTQGLRRAQELGANEQVGATTTAKACMGAASLLPRTHAAPRRGERVRGWVQGAIRVVFICICCGCALASPRVLVSLVSPGAHVRKKGSRLNDAHAAKALRKE
jgi:hypothetical protein